MLIAQVTDIHLGFEPGNPAEFNRQRLDQVLSALIDGPNRPDLLLATGDLTEHGDADSYRALAQAFARRGMNDLAARKFQEALKEKLVFDDEAKELRYQLGCVLETMGKTVEAIEQFKQIYEQDIGYRDVMTKVDAYYASQP